MPNNLKQVEEYWNKHLCGKHFIREEYPSKEFFAQYREFRYEKEHHLDHFLSGSQQKIETY